MHFAPPASVIRPWVPPPSWRDAIERPDARPAPRMAERIQPLLGYLSRLQARMDVEGFPIDDELLLLVRDAQDAVRAAVRPPALRIVRWRGAALK